MHGKLSPFSYGWISCSGIPAPGAMVRSMEQVQESATGKLTGMGLYCQGCPFGFWCPTWRQWGNKMAAPEGGGGCCTQGSGGTRRHRCRNWRVLQHPHILHRVAAAARPTPGAPAATWASAAGPEPRVPTYAACICLGHLVPQTE